MSDHSFKQATVQLENIKELIRLLHETEHGNSVIYEGEELDGEGIMREIEGTVIDIQVKTDWHSPGTEFSATDYRLLLCWGGPAVGITGTLDSHGNPMDAVLQHQDWGEPWMPYPLTEEEEWILIHFAEMFTYCPEL